MIPAQQMVNHRQAVRSLVFHDAGCLFSLPIRSVQVLWLAAGIGTGRPGSPAIAAQTLHMSAGSERTAEVRAITQLRAAGRRGCQTAAAPSPSGVVAGINASLPAILVTTAAQTVVSRPSRRSIHVASRRHRGAGSHREARRGGALETAAISTNPHDSMLLVWALLVLAALGMCGIVVLDRRGGIRWASGVAAAALDSGRGALSGLGGRSRPRRSLAGGPVVSRVAVLPPLAESTLEPSAPAGEIAAPADGWAPPFFAHGETAPIEEITAPPEGWAPPFFAPSQTAPIEEIAAPPEGWAPPIHRLAPPTGKAARPPSSDARRRAVAAGGALAAVLAVAAKPQRAIGRRHR
ncbi:MAG TPA: hypothetical protein VGF70_10315 [Solirubrobacteraceae bacterium]|jgi:hypothetical protein